MQTIKKYHLPADAEGTVEIRMPPKGTVLGVSCHGARGIVVRSFDNDKPENFAPRKFFIIREGEDCSRASNFRYLGDLLREVNGEPFVQYVFEWTEAARGPGFYAGQGPA